MRRLLKVATAAAIFTAAMLDLLFWLALVGAAWFVFRSLHRLFGGQG